MKPWMYILLALIAACTPTTGLNGWYQSDAASEASTAVDAGGAGDVGSVPVSDVPAASTDVVVLDRAIPVTDVVTVIDRPLIVDTAGPMPDIVQPRDSGSDVVGPRGILPGTRVRGTTNAALYYFARDGKIYLFPNDETYFSWYPSFDGVVTLSDVELNRIPRASSLIPMRAGTWLIKLRESPRTYALEFCGVRREIAAGNMSESVALALFGPNWNVGLPSDRPVPGVRRTRDVDVAFWSSYRDGAPITNYTHPDGSLIRYAGRSERYLVMNGRRRLITPEAFIANRFYEVFLVTTTLMPPEDTTPITGYEPALSEPVCLL